MEAPDDYWVHVQQPTVPHYRLAFFDAVASRLRGRLLVSASQVLRGGPNSVSARRGYLDLNHPCREMLRGRALWQHEMKPARGLRAGDVAVIAGNPRFLSTVRFAMLAKSRGMGIVWWGHGWSPTSRQWATRVRAGLMSATHAVLFYTDEEVAQWRPRLPQHIGLFGAQNAIDQAHTLGEVAHWSPARLAGFRAEHGLEGRQVLLFCGRLRTRPATGVDLLLKALPRLLAADPRYLVVVIGDGDDMQPLRQLSCSLGVDAHVRWLGARYEEADLAPWFLSSLCFVYPGPIGLSILHAMGYGLPVITHADRRYHNPEIVALRHGWNGFEFAAGDIDDLVRRIRAVADDTPLRDRLAGNARATALQEFSIERMAERFCAAVSYARRRSLAAGSEH